MDSTRRDIQSKTGLTHPKLCEVVKRVRAWRHTVSSAGQEKVDCHINRMIGVGPYSSNGIHSIPGTTLRDTFFNTNH